MIYPHDLKIGCWSEGRDEMRRALAWSQKISGKLDI
jgi:hypothetical protein